MAITDPWYGDDDTDCDYYDIPSGNIWYPDGGETARQAPGQEPGPRLAALALTARATTT
jgi:hypothetical protein